jgi:hypothetical protein
MGFDIMTYFNLFLTLIAWQAIESDWCVSVFNNYFRLP